MVNPAADAGALRRLVLSGHHGESWTNARPDVLWGSDSVNGHPHSVLTLFKEKGQSGVLQSLAELFPDAAAQVEHLLFSACLTGYQKCSSPPRIFAMFPNLKTLWGYDYESPGATNAGPAPHCKSSNRSLVVWEAATRLSNDAEALNRASETLRESIFRATRSLAEGDSRIGTREGPLRVKEYEKKKSSRSAGA